MGPGGVRFSRSHRGRSHPSSWYAGSKRWRQQSQGVASGRVLPSEPVPLPPVLCAFRAVQQRRAAHTWQEARPPPRVRGLPARGCLHEMAGRVALVRADRARAVTHILIPPPPRAHIRAVDTSQRRKTRSSAVRNAACVRGGKRASAAQSVHVCVRVLASVAHQLTHAAIPHTERSSSGSSSKRHRSRIRRSCSHLRGAGSSREEESRRKDVRVYV